MFVVNICWLFHSDVVINLYLFDSMEYWHWNPNGNIKLCMFICTHKFIMFTSDKQASKASVSPIVTQLWEEISEGNGSICVE